MLYKRRTFFVSPAIIESKACQTFSTKIIETSQIVFLVVLYLVFSIATVWYMNMVWFVSYLYHVNWNTVREKQINYFSLSCFHHWRNESSLHVECTRSACHLRDNVIIALRMWSTMFLNHRAAARYRALASIIPGRERPEETTIYYKISLVQLITNWNVILYLSTCHTVYISVLILFMIML